MNKTTHTTDSQSYAIGAATVSLLLASEIRKQEPENSERRKKMARVIGSLAVLTCSGDEFFS